MKGLRDMTSTLRRHRLPSPPVPEPLQARVLRQRDWVWGTRVDLPRLYDMASYIDGTTDTPVEDFFILGHDGYGTNSWFLHCYLQHGPLSAFIQTPWGGAYADEKRATVAIQRSFVLLERLLVATDQALIGGHSLPGRLIVQQSSVEPPRWGWLTGDQTVTWHGESADAMTPALQSLESHKGRRL
jgi:hypothetical protein